VNYHHEIIDFWVKSVQSPSTGVRMVGDSFNPPKKHCHILRLGGSSLKVLMLLLEAALVVFLRLGKTGEKDLENHVVWMVFKSFWEARVNEMSWIIHTVFTRTFGFDDQT